MLNQAVQIRLEKDCNYIFQALEHLSKGVCSAQETGKICSWELMPKIHEALKAHIEYEVIWVFPELMPDELQRHKLEHERLLRLLAKASYEFECGYGDQFIGILEELTKALRDHAIRS